MIEVRLTDPFDRERWEATLLRCGGSPLHLPAIHVVDHDRASVRGLCFERDGDLLGCSLALEVQPRRARGLLRGPKQLQLPSAPAVVRPEERSVVRGALFSHARASRCERLLVHASGSDWLVDDPDLAHFRTEAITEFVLDLRAGADAVQAGMHKQHRKNARRAARDGLVIEQDDSLEGLLELRQMQVSSSVRASERAEGFGVRDDAFFERLHAEVYGPGHGHVLFARLGDRRIAALAWIEAAARVQTVRSGSLAEGYELRAMYLLYDELIRRAAAEGRVELNAGGVPVDAARADHPQNGLYEFKNGFGGRAVSRWGLDVAIAEVRA